jgi:hypothetical protein
MSNWAKLGLVGGIVGARSNSESESHRRALFPIDIIERGVEKTIYKTGCQTEKYSDWVASPERSRPSKVEF